MEIQPSVIVQTSTLLMKDLRQEDGLEYDRFIWYHASCPGFSNDGNMAICSGPTHKEVKSTGAPKGYISK